MRFHLAFQACFDTLDVPEHEELGASLERWFGLEERQPWQPGIMDGDEYLCQVPERVRSGTR